MVRRYHELCPKCLEKDVEIHALTKERDDAREHAVRWEHEAHNLRREVQRLRMECTTERIQRPI
jgi:hypothetical protein